MKYNFKVQPMNTRELQRRLQAAEDILNGQKTTFEKFRALRNLVKGLSSKIDSSLEAAGKELDKLEHTQKGEVISLLAEELPEMTEEQKKRKKILLFFTRHWREIKSEVARIKSELAQVKKHGETTASKAKGLGRILSFAKGPLGLITVIAAGIVILQSLKVKITVKNVGCEPLPFFSSPIPIPGLVLPREPITSGNTGVIYVPPLNINIDNSLAGQLKISVFGIGKSVDFAFKELIFDGSSLKGKSTLLSLDRNKEHTLEIICR